MTFRDEEDQVSAQYFCRVRSGQMNFSNNPTFVSGSLNELRQKTMKKCDFKATIPMKGKINSLNVSAAVSAILFERQRQLNKD